MHTSIARFISCLLLPIPIALSSAVADSDKPSTLVNPPWKHTLGLHRVGQRHLDFYSGYRKKFVNPQAVAATKLFFNDEPGAGDDFELTLYGINAGTNEVFYNKSMVSLGFYGAEANQNERLRDAVGICCDAIGNVFIGDTGNNRVVHLVNRNNELSYRTAFDFAESGLALARPTGVALEARELYVCDTGNDRVIVASPAGRVQRTLLADAYAVAPTAVTAIAANDFNFYEVAFVAVIDSAGQRLSVCDPAGNLLGSLRYGEISGADGRFGFAAFDYYANLYVTDEVSGCVFKFDRYLRFITRIGCGLDDGDDLDEPRGIAVYRRFGQVFVAERRGASYFWVGTDVEHLSCRAQQTDASVIFDVRFLLTERASVTVRLEAEDGDPVVTLADREVMQAGQLSMRYQVPLTDLPCPVANCKYRLTVSARATYSSRPYHEVSRTARVR